MDYRKETLNIIDRRFDISKAEKAGLWEALKESTKNGRKVLFLFGCGLLGKSLYNMFREEGFSIEGFVDNDVNKWGKEIIDGKKCISPQQLYQVENPVVFITVGKKPNIDIYHQLQDSPIKEIYRYPLALFESMHNNHMKYSKEQLSLNMERLFEVLEDEESEKIAYWQVKSWLADAEELNSMEFKRLYSDEAYIPGDIFTFDENEVILDCGAYNGDTFRYLMENGIDWNKYIAFEMSEKNCSEFQQYADTLQEKTRRSLEIYHYGVGEREENVRYMENLAGSHAAADAACESRIIVLDQFLKESVSYIKMDIEGSEMPALRGGHF